MRLITEIDAAVDKQFRTFDNNNRHVLISNMNKEDVEERLHEVVEDGGRP